MIAMLNNRFINQYESFFIPKTKPLFGQQVSQEVAHELIAQENDFEGKSLEITVLFLDIRNFSKFADNKEPTEAAAHSLTN